MIIPVRCYSCGAVIANRYEKYKQLLDQDYTEAEALDSLRLPRYCCRRMILSHIDLVDDLIPYSAPVVGNMQAMGPQSTHTGAVARGNGSVASGSSAGLSSSAATSSRH